MAKRIMEDIQPKRITKIKKQDIIASEPKRPNYDFEKNERQEIRIMEERPKELEREEIKIQKHDQFFRRDNNRLFQTPRIKRRRINVRKMFMPLMVIIIILGIYYISYKFENTKIYIKEKHGVFNLNKEQFKADGTADATAHLELMIVSDETTKDVVLTNSEDVSLKAQGEVTLYNEYSTKPQNLLIHTFLSDEKGKTYQTNKAVTIPGFTKVGDVLTPGQATVGISSFLPGNAYNGSPNSFMINMFKNTPKEKKFYGKLKSPLTGGAQGIVYKPAPDDIGAMNTEAISNFKKNLIKKVNVQVPSGYILYPNAISFTYNIDNNVLSSTPNAKIKINGTISSFLLKEKDLTKIIVKRMMPDITQKEADEITIPNLANLTFSFASPGQDINKDVKSLSFILSGTVNPIWHPNTQTLKENLVGISKAELPAIFKSDPGIISASARIFPPWSNHLPQTITKFKILTE